MTQRDKVLRHLEHYGTITPLEDDFESLVEPIDTTPDKTVETELADNRAVRELDFDQIKTNFRNLLFSLNLLKSSSLYFFKNISFILNVS